MDTFLLGNSWEELINRRQDLSVSGFSGQTAHDSILITRTETLSINELHSTPHLPSTPPPSALERTGS